MSCFTLRIVKGDRDFDFLLAEPNKYILQACRKPIQPILESCQDLYFLRRYFDPAADVFGSKMNFWKARW